MASPSNAEHTPLATSSLEADAPPSSAPATPSLEADATPSPAPGPALGVDDAHVDVQAPLDALESEEVDGVAAEAQPDGTLSEGAGIELVIIATPLNALENKEVDGVAAEPQQDGMLSEGAGMQLAIVATPPPLHQHQPRLEGTPAWLPPGWEVQTRQRMEGATRGKIDRYYYNRDLDTTLRSKNEVLSFTETGKVTRKSRSKATKSVARPSEHPLHQSKASGSKRRCLMHSDTPEKGKLDQNKDSDFDEESLAFDDFGEEVPLSVRKEWWSRFKRKMSGNKK